jgi:hypothetical protein
VWICVAIACSVVTYLFHVQPLVWAAHLNTQLAHKSSASSLRDVTTLNPSHVLLEGLNPKSLLSTSISGMARCSHPREIMQLGRKKLKLVSKLRQKKALELTIPHVSTLPSLKVGLKKQEIAEHFTLTDIIRH